MKAKTLFFFLSCNIILSQLGLSQNLIINSSFEQSSQAWGYGWYDLCGDLVFTTPDTSCGGTYSNDVPPGGGSFSLRVDGMGNNPPGWAKTIISPSTGANVVVDVNGWTKKQYASGSGIIALEKKTGNQYTVLKSVQITDTVWTLYSFSDTLNIGLTDTIVVSVYAVAAGPLTEYVFADLMYAQAFNVLSTNKNEGKQEEISVFPNPTKGKITLLLNNFHKETMQIEIFNAIGQQIFSEEMKPLNDSIHKEYDLKNGIYQIKVITPSAIYQKSIVVE